MSQRAIHKLDQLIGLLSRGRFAERCDEHLADALAALTELPSEKGKAEINIKITISYDSGRIDITPVVKSKLPEGKAFSATPFWEFENGLSVQHPNQHDMFGPRDALRDDAATSLINSGANRA